MMTPQPVREACGRGLAEWHRHQVGGNGPSVDFARYAMAGGRLDQTQAAECLAAHRRLDLHVIEVGGETRESAISRNLWGGDQGRDFAQRIMDDIRHTPPQVVPTIDEIRLPDPPALPDRIEPLPVEPETPIAAELELDTQFLERINAAAGRLNMLMFDRLEGAIRAIYLALLRDASREAQRRTSRVAAPIAAELDMTAIREAMGLRTDHTRWLDARPVFAMLDTELADAIEGALADLRITADEILEEGHEELVARLARELGTTEENIRATLEAEMAGQRFAAVTLLVNRVRTWITGLFSRADEPEDLPTAAQLPVNLVGDTVAVAGGALAGEVAVARSVDNALISAAGNPVDGQAASGWAARAVSEAFEGAIDSTRVSDLLEEVPAGAPTVEVVQVMEWDYGDISERFQPYQPHVDLDGDRWRGETDVHPSGAYPQEHHPNCRCTIRIYSQIAIDGIIDGQNELIDA